MNDLNSQLKQMDADRLADVAAAVQREQQRRVPQKTPSEMSDREVQAWTDALIAEAERKKREAANG